MKTRTLESAQPSAGGSPIEPDRLAPALGGPDDLEIMGMLGVIDPDSEPAIHAMLSEIGAARDGKEASHAD